MPSQLKPNIFMSVSRHLLQQYPSGGTQSISIANQLLIETMLPIVKVLK
jgi:hypothetical protein